VTLEVLPYRVGIRVGLIHYLENSEVLSDWLLYSQQSFCLLLFFNLLSVPLQLFSLPLFVLLSFIPFIYLQSYSLLKNYVENVAVISTEMFLYFIIIYLMHYSRVQIIVIIFKFWVLSK
jgi:hypothetical protein